MNKVVIGTVLTAALVAPVQAEQYWADNSVSVLYGQDYKLVPEEKLTTMTLEHASGHSWGGLFFFVDRHVGETGEDGVQFKETYGEFSPKFTVVKMDGFVSAINAAFTYEFGSSSNSSGQQDNYLYGVGADLNVPGMNYASATYFYANNDNVENDHQLTLTYGWNKGNFNIDGYIDYSTATEDLNAQFHFNPQITYNVGPALGISNKIKVGVEYSYWNNKFGLNFLEDDDKDQNAVSFIIKAHL